MTKLEILKMNYKNSTITPNPENHELFTLDKGTKNEMIFRVLTLAETFEAVKREIKAQIVFIDPSYISAFCANIVPMSSQIIHDIVKIWKDGDFDKAPELLLILISQAGGIDSFCDAMIKNLGSGYFLGSFENRQIRLNSRYLAFRID